jgi:hypothetical protein
VPVPVPPQPPPPPPPPLITDHPSPAIRHRPPAIRHHPSSARQPHFHNFHLGNKALFRKSQMGLAKGGIELYSTCCQLPAPFDHLTC